MSGRHLPNAAVLAVMATCCSRWRAARHAQSGWPEADHARCDPSHSGPDPQGAAGDPKDPRSRISLLVPPIMQCLIFGYAATYDLNHVPYAVLDQDRSAASHELLANARRLGRFRPRRRSAPCRATSLTYIDDRRALLVVQIGQDFERRLHAGASRRRAGDRRRPQLQHRRHGARLCRRRSSTASTPTGAATTALAARAAQVISRAWYNPNLETRWNMIPALIGTLTLMQT